jgi:hypothetical protein
VRNPSPATVIATVALFVALGGVGVAATGGNFILGHENSATSTSLLGSGVTSGPTLRVTNSGGRPAARFDSNANVAPLVVSNATRVQNLNSDLLDGIDSTGFTQGSGHLYSAHVDRVQAGANGTLLTLPGGFALSYFCDTSLGTGLPEGALYDGNLTVVYELDGGRHLLQPRSSVDWNGRLFTFNALGSQPMSKTGDKPMLVDLRFTGAGDPQLNRCSFQAVAEVFA